VAADKKGNKKILYRSTRALHHTGKKRTDKTDFQAGALFLNYPTFSLGGNV
jgi:hypothetical protein